MLQDHCLADRVDHGLLRGPSFRRHSDIFRVTPHAVDLHPWHQRKSTWTHKARHLLGRCICVAIHDVVVSHLMCHVNDIIGQCPMGPQGAGLSEVVHALYAQTTDNNYTGLSYS